MLHKLCTPGVSHSKTACPPSFKIRVSTCNALVAALHFALWLVSRTCNCHRVTALLSWQGRLGLCAVANLKTFLVPSAQEVHEGVTESDLGRQRVFRYSLHSCNRIRSDALFPTPVFPSTTIRLAARFSTSCARFPAQSHVKLMNFCRVSNRSTRCIV